MTRFKFFGFLLPLAMAGGLALGLAPALANHLCTPGTKFENHPHCTGDAANSTDGVPALLTLDGDLSTDDGATDMLDVKVTQSTPKRLQINNGRFLEPGIQVDFGLDLGEDEGALDLGGKCEVERDGLGSAVGPSNLELLKELNMADIQDGSLIFRIDKKNLTAIFVIEYLVVGGPLEGRIRIQTISFGRDAPTVFVTGFDESDPPESLEFPVIDLTIRGSMGIWWSDLSGLNEDRILVCSGQVVDVDLIESP